jgi:hypothetical protein
VFEPRRGRPDWLKTFDPVAYGREEAIRLRRAEKATRAQDASLITIYRRPDGYYLVSSDRTTIGVWVEPAQQPVVVERAAATDAIGRAALDLVSRRAAVVAHPRQDEWTAFRRANLAPLQRRARVRSWRAFVAPADLVSVHRLDDLITVTPQLRDLKRTDVFTANTERSQELTAPTPQSLGVAIVAAFE